MEIVHICVLIFLEVSSVNVMMDMSLMEMEHLAMVCIINHTSFETSILYLDM